MNWVALQSSECLVPCHHLPCQRVAVHKMEHPKSEPKLGQRCSAGVVAWLPMASYQGALEVTESMGTSFILSSLHCLAYWC